MCQITDDRHATNSRRYVEYVAIGGIACAQAIPPNNNNNELTYHAIGHEQRFVLASLRHEIKKDLEEHRTKMCRVGRIID